MPSLRQVRNWAARCLRDPHPDVISVAHGDGERTIRLATRKTGSDEPGDVYLIEIRKEGQ